MFVFSGLSVSAEENEYIVENHNLIEKYLADIGLEISDYTKKDTSEGDRISEGVVSVINAYRKKLIDLESHKDVGDRLLRSEIDLAYERCTSAGRIAWIYHFAIAKISSDSSVAAIDTVYRECLKTIDGTGSASVLKAKATELCADLNSAVYGEKLSLLEREGDTPKCIGYIEDAKEALITLRDPELDAPLLVSLYSDTEKKLTLQRARDSLCAELEAVFAIARPSESFSSNKKMALFLLRLDNAQALSEMNEAAQNAVADLLPSSGGRYVQAFNDNINLSVASAVTKANGGNTAVSLTHLFDGYSVKYKRVEAKDRIAAILLEGASHSELEAIEKSFNSENGIIDSCPTAAQIDAEVIRASYKKSIFNAFDGALQDLAVIMGEYDRKSIEEELTNSYSVAQKELDSLAYSSNIFDENCNSLLKSSERNFDSILNKAKAQRFLLDNKSIIVKPSAQISKNDEISLRAALISYRKLEPEVRELILSEINLIVEKYKSCLIDKVFSLVENDSLYKELCAYITDEIKALSTNDIDVFYNICDKILQKSDVLAQTLKYYRSICSSDLYPLYSQSERKSLEDACKGCADALSKTDVFDAEEYGESLNNVLKNTITKFDRIDLCASVRIAGKNSKNPNIQKLVTSTCSLIEASSDKNEMLELAELAIFKINRLLTADEIITRSEKLKYKLEEMKFLTLDERALFSSRAEQIKKTFADKAALCENLAVLTFIWDTFSEELSSISTEAQKKDLEHGKENYSELITKDLSALEDALEAMAHLNEKRKKELVSSAASIVSKFNADLGRCETGDALIFAYSSALEQLKALRISASSENLEAYKTVVKAEIDKLLPEKSNYSNKAYNSILSIIKKAKESLASCTQISDCTALIDSTRKDISKVGDLLDDAKAEALEALEEALKSCTDLSSLYSSENLSLAKDLYDRAVKSISQFEKISEIDALKGSLSQSLSLIRDIPKDILFTVGGEGLLAAGAQYPLGYSFSSLGYWGRIYSKGGISSSAVFSIRELTLGEDIEELRDSVRRAAKKNALKIYGGADEKRIELMKKCVIAMGLDITLSSVAPSTEGYSLQMLLPPSLRDENVLGLVFIDKNGDVEYYPTQQRDMLISLELSHLSRYYIVCENTVDLTPLLIFLIILLVFEVIAFCFILFLRYNRRRKDKDMLPEKFLYSFSPIFMSGALKITPNNGVALAVVLSVAALALGCAVAFLARTEISALKKKSIPREGSKRNAKIPSSVPEALEEREILALPKREKIPVLCGASAECDEDIETVAVAPEPREEQENDLAEDKKAPSHRAEVNLDVIARKFKSGELVTLEALKRKRLVNERCDHVKILARGTLTKPLIIEAHDFSRAAEEMLLAVGGEAIRI